MTSVRPSAVAGRFYPGDAAELDRMVQGYLADGKPDGGAAPKALIAPHAGYVYSGALAAKAYAWLAPARATIKRVVLLGPAHRVAFKGIAASGASAFATPFGEVLVDAEAVARVAKLPQVEVFDEAHRQEHSLEVHLPFLQRTLDDFKLVPLVVGQATGAQVAEVLEQLWGGPETVIVVSSDLSHYLDYDSAQKLDAATSTAIENYRPDDIAHEQACGRIPIKGLLSVARRRAMQIGRVGLCNSGDTAGSRDRVVGYGAWLFRETEGAGEAVGSPPERNAEQAARRLVARHGPTLLRIALTSVLYGLKHGKPFPAGVAKYPPALRAQGASFVTLKLGGKLRGCIGSLIKHRPLVSDVAINGFSAAFKDPRFKPLGEANLDALDVEVSLLSDPVPLPFTDEADLLAKLRPGIDGLILHSGDKRGLFLPSVWSQLPAPKDFLDHLKVKAGLKAKDWPEDMRASHFTTVSTAFSTLGKKS